MVAWTAERLHASLHVGIKGAGVCDIAACTKNNFSGLRGELAACIRRAGLYDNGPALNRTRNIEWAANFQKLSIVVKDVELFGIEVDACFHVANERIVGPAIP